MGERWFRAFNIQWDTDKMRTSQPPPSEVTVGIDPAGSDASAREYIGRWLTDEYGEHKSFELEDVTHLVRKRPIIYSIDFDGTIVSNHYPGIGDINPDFERLMGKIKQAGDVWILNTMREGKELQEAVDFLKERGYVPDAVNDNIESMKKLFLSNPRKIYADVYIDDHNAGGLRWP